MIKKETKRDILDHLNQEQLHFSGKMSDANFLSRLYDLKNTSSTDYKNALEEINSYEYNGNYYQEPNWIFDDQRFSLLDGDSEIFLRFICMMAHPLVRDYEDASNVIKVANEWLKDEGWELYPERSIANGNIYNFRRSNEVQPPSKEEVQHIWQDGKLKFFISHRDIHKAGA